MDCAMSTLKVDRPSLPSLAVSFSELLPIVPITVSVASKLATIAIGRKTHPSFLFGLFVTPPP